MLATFAACGSDPPPRTATRVTAAPTPAATPVPSTAPTVPATRRPPTAAPTAAPLPVAACVADGCFDIDRAMAHVEVLATDVGPRPAGSVADRRAADYAKAELEKAGLRAWLMPFDLPQGGISWNVVGVPEGIELSPDERDPPAPPSSYLIVGGHIDTVPAAPGGNDNASGIGVILDYARALRVQPPRMPVVYVAFGAEEVQPGQRPEHHVGSAAYVDRMSAEARRNLVAMLNVDMVGWGDSLVFGRLSVGPREATQRLVRLAARLGIRGAERTTPDWSDNGSFLKAGLNAGWIWAGDDSVKHTPQDTYAHVQRDPVEWAGRLGLDFLRSR